MSDTNEPGQPSDFPFDLGSLSGEHHLPPLEGPLEGLEPEDLEALEVVGTWHDFPVGAVIIEQGSLPVDVHVLATGRVRVVLRRPDGRRVLLGIRGPGAVLGDLSLLDEGHRSADVIALDEVTTLRVPAFDHLAWLTEHPGVMLGMLKLLGRRLRETERRLADVRHHTPTVRLARQLLEHAMSVDAQVDAKGELSVPIDVENLADWIRGTPIQAEDALRTLERSRLVRAWGNGLTLLDLEGLRVVAML